MIAPSSFWPGDRLARISLNELAGILGAGFVILGEFGDFWGLDLLFLAKCLVFNTPEHVSIFRAHSEAL